MPEGAALSWSFSDIVIRRKGRLAFRYRVPGCSLLDQWPEAARPGRCRALRRRSLHYALQTSIIRTYALASRLRASWMEARVTKVARGSVRFSKSLARRRLLPNQEKVRSTTRRRGRTAKPFMSSLRLTISIRRFDRLAVENRSRGA